MKQLVKTAICKIGALMHQHLMSSIFHFHNHTKTVKQNPFRRLSYLAVILLVAMTPFISHKVFANGSQGSAELYIDGQTIHVATNAKTVRDVISDAGYSVGDKDIVEPSLDTEIGDGYKINVYRAVPVTIEDKGANVELETAQKTGEAISAEAGLKLHPEDKYKIEASDISDRKSVV